VPLGAEQVISLEGFVGQGNRTKNTGYFAIVAKSLALIKRRSHDVA
jgi:hypothetical protein